jgi:type VI secretion system secreted protein VgrG
MGTLFAQAGRMGRLSTVLGLDVLVLQRFAGHEALSSAFQWQVDCLAIRSDIDFDALIGTHATVTLVTRTGDRLFDGVVTEAQWLGSGENGMRYRLVLRPWFHLTRYRRNQRIFHNKTVVEILTELLVAYADVGQMEPSLTNDYPTLEYTVQYRESDHDFACRLMERFGISYHFVHASGAHKMILTDNAQSHPTIGMRPFLPDDGHHQADITHFWEWQPLRRMTTGAIRLTDYNFKTPTAAMEVDHTGDAAFAQGSIESFDWPGDYLDQPRGQVVARMRTEAERGQDRRYTGVGDIAELGAGQRVTLGGEPAPGAGEEFLCLTATHSYQSDSYGSGALEGDSYSYSGRYVLTPVSAPMLPERKTARADVKGPQTAVVVGEGEIDCDEFGRILVRFHWDLAKANSMRCRVSQNWAGNGWGGMVIPRIGMEVLVEFLDGDPDQPLVTGCVYNGKNKVPYALPQHKTRSTFKTDTHEGEGYNELRFEDQKGREEIYLHAQLDHSIKVLNHQTNRVDRTKIESIGAASLREVRLIDVHNIGMDMTINVGTGPHGNFVRKPLIDNPQGIRMAAYNFEQSFPELSGKGNYTLTAASAIALSAGTTFSQSIGGEASLTYGASLSQSVHGDIRETAGKNHSQVVGAKYRLDAHEGIHLRSGASELIMKPDGTVLINGKDITTSMSGNMTDKVTGNLVVKANKIDVN